MFLRGRIKVAQFMIVASIGKAYCTRVKPRREKYMKLLLPQRDDKITAASKPQKKNGVAAFLGVRPSRTANIFAGLSFYRTPYSDEQHLAGAGPYILSHGLNAHPVESHAPEVLRSCRKPEKVVVEIERSILPSVKRNTRRTETHTPP